MFSGDYMAIQRLMQEGVAKGVFPGAVLYVRAENRVVFCEAYGLADITTRETMTTETVFDLASLTKPLATAPAVLKLFDTRKLAPNERLGAVLPLFAATPWQAVTMADLLCHTAGFPPHKPYYQELALLPPARDRREAVLEMVAAESPYCAPGEKAIYSDLGYMVLRGVVEAVMRMRLDRLVTGTLYRLLGRNDLFFIDRFSPEMISGRTFAATEECPRRKKLLKGEVHDDNAYEVGGIDGQAGLFGTAPAVGDFLAELLAVYHGEPGRGLLCRNSVVHMLEQQGQTGRTWGFDMPAAEGSAAGRCFSSASVGHLGFTGTSCWMDVPRKIMVLLFTNRVHPDRGNEAIRAFRPRLHDTVMQTLEDR